MYYDMLYYIIITIVLLSCAGAPDCLAEPRRPGGRRLREPGGDLSTPILSLQILSMRKQT